ncbi:MAG: ABC transporter ATP-binding protein [Lachnospiraceae bacterium]|jgi:ABC-2 type transport system ATP-binding protein|nr:ABC transporter ATP-binding protein [Lachnospiraceae bacterium]
MKVVEIKDLSKSFGKFKALDKVSFSIDEGEIFGFLGPNGAGKTTTIRCLLGMMHLDEGSIKILGEDASLDVVKTHKNLAYVPGDVFLWPNLTGGEIIDLLLKMSGQRWSKETDRLIKVFDLEQRKKARTYSKGNRQKVALIAALSLDVPLYIFDEPTSGLDPLQELNFQNEILRLKASGKTVLLSSHILSEVEKVVERVAIIKEGHIVENGSISEMNSLSKLEIKATINGIKKEFKIDSKDIASALEKLSKENITDLEIKKPSLEEMFMWYYDKEVDYE